MGTNHRRTCQCAPIASLRIFTPWSTENRPSHLCDDSGLVALDNLVLAVYSLCKLHTAPARQTWTTGIEGQHMLHGT
jgi:hypothetical protein